MVQDGPPEEAVLEALPDLILALDSRSLRILWVNRSGGTSLGFANEELLQMSPLELLPRLSRTQLDELIKDLLHRAASSGPRAGRLETVAKAKSGEERFVDIRFSVANRSHLIVASVRDIQHRIELEEQLRRTNRFLDAIVENVPDMIFVKDAANLLFERFNRAGEDLLGWTRAELLGKT